MTLEDGERVGLSWSLYTSFLLPEEFELMRFLESTSVQPVVSNIAHQIDLKIAGPCQLMWKEDEKAK